ITPDSKSQLYNNLLNIGGTTELMSLSPFFKTIAIPLAGLSTIYSNEGASLKFYNTIMNALKQIRDNNNKLSDLEKKAIDTLENAVREKVFFIPAQRSSAISEGRIQLSRDFVNSPYILIKFSGYLQQFVKSQQNGLISETIKNYDFLKDTEINMRRSAGSPRLEMTINKQTIPYMAWSTGQRELTPLLMSLEYFESIPNKDYIIIEEPEIGLHPRAIIEFMFTVLKLMKSGVKVVISTHSSTPLDFVWAMNHLKESNADIANIAEMFDFKIKDKSVFDGLAEKVIKVYYFSPDKKTRKVYSKDISSLDVYSEDEDVSNWGGMSLSADRAGSIVSKF
ncbi:MAG: ATP-binding protein, partial [Alphaproteobacteria bacterium]|nr:ATP-binding protein [Alphaproteobacteria bacterium]